MIAPDLRAQRRRRRLVAGERSRTGRPGGCGPRGRAFVPRTGHLDRRMSMTHTESQGRQRLERRRHRRRRRPQEEHVSLRPAYAGLPAAVREDHRGDAVPCPVAWSDTYDGHWVAAGSKEVFELARCPRAVQRPRPHRRDAATRASPSRRRSGPRSCAAASWRWTSPSTAPTAAR